MCYQQPLQCFEPFLNVARAKDVSGLITAAAVQAVHRLLTLGFIDPASEQAPDVINHVAQCVMWTRFVPAGAEENDRVTAQILEVRGCTAHYGMPRVLEGLCINAPVGLWHVSPCMGGTPDWTLANRPGARRRWERVSSAARGAS